MHATARAGARDEELIMVFSYRSLAVSDEVKHSDAGFDKNRLFSLKDGCGNLC